MKKLTRLVLPACLSILTTGVLGTIAQAMPVISGPNSIQPIADYPRIASTLELNAPTIVSSGVEGSHHFIRIAVIGMSLKDVMVSLPEQMERFDNVQVRDQMGKTIPAQVSVVNHRATFNFEQPVSPGMTIEVSFNGVEMRGAGGENLLYGVTAERVGLMGEIPVGTAQVHVPNRS